MPSLPEGYFWRVATLLGSPILELRLKFGFFSKRVNTIWIQEPTDEHLIEQAEYLKSLLAKEDKTELFLEKRIGDYPPRTLNG